MHVQFINAHDGPINRSGKISDAHFFGVFDRIAPLYGISRSLKHGKTVLAHGAEGADVAVLIYNELDTARPERLAYLRAVEAAARASGAVIVHPVETGLIVGNKLATNQALRAAGVPVVSVIDDAVSDAAVFSNAQVGSKAGVHVVEPGEALDPSRFNAALVDTRHPYLGREYFTCLRIMSFGAKVVAVYPRARSVKFGSPVVHAGDMPPCATFFQHMDQTIIRPNMPRFRTIAANVGRALGPGFYAIDVLPERGVGRLYACEVNIGFDEGSLRKRMAPALSALPELAGRETEKMSHAFCGWAARTVGVTKPLPLTA